MVLPLQQCLFLSSPHFIPSRRQSAFCMPPKKWCVVLRKSTFFFHPRASLRLRVAMKALPLSNAAKTPGKRVGDKVWGIIAKRFSGHAQRLELYPFINIPSESSGAPPESSRPPPLVPSACSGTPPLFGGRRSSPPGWGEPWVAG